MDILFGTSTGLFVSYIAAEYWWVPDVSMDRHPNASTQWKEVDVKKEHEDLLIEHKRLAKETLIKYIRDVCSAIIDPSVGGDVGSSNAVEEEPEPEDRLAAI